MDVFFGFWVGAVGWFLFRYGLLGFYTISPNERAVLCTFGRAQRLVGRTNLDEPEAANLSKEERERYVYPQLRVIGPGFYWKLPWQTLHRASLSTTTVSIGYDPEDLQANRQGSVLEAVTKDQLNTGLTGQLRFQVSERNLYAYLFGVKKPLAHVMAYFVSILRDRIANFEQQGPAGEAGTDNQSMMTASINDLRKNLRLLNDRMEVECARSPTRYGMRLEAALITGIDPPPDVDAALAAINTAHNHVSSEISLAQASADQRIVQSRRAVEIETLKAYAEVEPLVRLAEQLRELAGMGGVQAVRAYVRNIRVALHKRAHQVVLTSAEGDR